MTALSLKIMNQLDDAACGPTCLQAIYNYYGDKISLKEVEQQAHSLSGGGTLAVLLANHALKRGYKVKIYTYDLDIFDPSWFDKKTNISEKLREQLRYKKGNKFRYASKAFLEFLNLGGVVEFQDLNAALLRKYLHSNIQILAGLSSTYLYRSPREYYRKSESRYDDVRGVPIGHFVVLLGLDDKNGRVIVADPYKDNPLSKDNYYSVEIGRIVNAIMLAVETYDSNLVIIEPKDSKIKLKESKEKFLRPEGEKRESFFSRYFYRLSKLLTKDKKR